MTRTFALCFMGIALAAIVFADTPVTIPDAPWDDGRNESRSLDQGGERCESATVITSLPYCDTGTTVGYINDYVPPCADNSQAPDVVYRYTPTQTEVVSFSLCGSSYNTVLHIWRGCPTGGGVLFCCNDDFCGMQSCCPGLTLGAGFTYFIIVDGAGQAAGDYILNVIPGQGCPSQDCGPPDSCVVQCPTNGIPEGEPCPNFPDNFNGGCNSPNPMFSPIQCGQTICGRSVVTAGAGRDNDWYQLNLTFRDSIIWCVEAEFPVEIMIERPGPNGCADRDTIARAVGLPCSLVCISACLDPGQYSLVVSPFTTIPFPCADYVANLQCLPCAVQDTCPYPNEDIEPNNLCADQNPTLSCPDTVCGTISPQGDGDYYEFRIPTGNCGIVTIDVFGNDTPGWWPFGQGMNPTVCQYQVNSSTLILCDNDGGVGNDAHLVSPCLPAGLYELRVGDNNSNTTGPYVLKLACEPCECPPDTCPYPDLDFDPANDNCGTQNPFVTCDDTTCGLIAPPNDHDWYLIQLNQTPCGRIVIDVFADDTPGWWPFDQGLDPRVWLVSANCSTMIALDENGGVGNDARLISPCLPPGLYHILVEGGDPFAPSVGPYIFAVDCQPCPCPGDSCHVVCDATPEGEPCPNVPDNFNAGCHSTPPSFRNIECPTTICGTAFAQNGVRDEDWYRVRVFDPDTIWWCVEAEFPVEIAMFAAGPGLNPCLDHDTLDCARGDSCEIVCVGACVEPGLYFFYVAPLAFDSIVCRDYRASLLCTICGPQHCDAPDSVVIHYPTIANDDIHLYWPPVPAADEYRIYRSDNSELPPSPLTYLATTTDTFFVDTGIIGAAAIKNFYTVVAHCPAPGCGP